MKIAAQKRQQPIVILLIAIAVFSYLIPPVEYFFVDPDQGVQLAIGDKILNGEQPYIDVAVGIYGPLVFYATALFQYLFNKHLAGEIILIILAFAITTTFLFILINKITGKSYLAFLTTLLFILLCPRFYKYYIVLGPIIFLSALFRFTRSSKITSAFILGIACGINILYRFDLGAVCVFTSFLVITIIKRSSFTDFCYSSIATLSGILITILPWLIYLSTRIELFEFFIKHFSQIKDMSSGLYLPSPKYHSNEALFTKLNSYFFLYYLFPLVPIALIASLPLHKSQRTPKIFLFACSIFSLLLFAQALHRSDIPHFLQAIFPSIVTLGILWSIIIETISTKRISIIVLACFAAIVTILCFPLSFATSIEGKAFASTDFWSKIYTYTLSRSETRKYLLQNPPGGYFNWAVNLSEYLHNHTDTRDSIIIWPYQPQLYYWSERPFATTRSHLIPNRLTEDKQQEKIINQISQANVKYIVDFPNWSYDSGNDATHHKYFSMVMSYIKKNYKIVKKFGNATLLIKLNIDTKQPSTKDALQ